MRENGAAHELAYCAFITQHASRITSLRFYHNCINRDNQRAQVCISAMARINCCTSNLEFTLISLLKGVPAMNVLLLSMPDSFEHMPAVAIRMPNGALASLAGNLDPHHQVAIADLILAQDSVRATLERLVRDIAPDVVGLSVM